MWCGSGSKRQTSPSPSSSLLMCSPPGLAGAQPKQGELGATVSSSPTQSAGDAPFAEGFESDLEAAFGRFGYEWDFGDRTTSSQPAAVSHTHGWPAMLTGPVKGT